MASAGLMPDEDQLLPGPTPEKLTELDRLMAEGIDAILEAVSKPFPLPG